VAHLRVKPQQLVLELGPFTALQERLSLCSRCTHVDAVPHSTIVLSPTVILGHLLLLGCIPKP